MADKNNKAVRESNGNGKFIITIIIIIGGFIFNWGCLQATIAGQQKQIDSMVTRAEYIECVKRIDENIKLLLSRQAEENQ